MKKRLNLLTLITRACCKQKGSTDAGCNSRYTSEIESKLATIEDGAAKYENVLKELDAANAQIVTLKGAALKHTPNFSCPECGCIEHLNRDLVGEGYRMCRDCQQDWWVDVYYSSTPEPRVDDANDRTYKRIDKLTAAAKAFQEIDCYIVSATADDNYNLLGAQITHIQKLAQEGYGATQN